MLTNMHTAAVAMNSLSSNRFDHNFRHTVYTVFRLSQVWWLAVTGYQLQDNSLWLVSLKVFGAFEVALYL